MIQFDKSRVKILICDDEESIRTMIAMTLREEGWSVEIAENGKKGLETLERASFHIVMSDIQMPEMTGIELLAKVKEKFPLTEFVIMTSNATLETAMQAIKLGAYDYLTKPFEDLSVVSKKMIQVAEKILLRQQNAELIKRLRKASLELKVLFELSSHLNGILEENSLIEESLRGLHKIFQDNTVYGAWFVKGPEGFTLLKQAEGTQIFKDDEKFDSLQAINERLTGLRQPREVALIVEGQPERYFIFESPSPELADLFAHEVKVCFEKVMRHQEVLMLANKDGLTRLYNHRYFQDRLRQELAQVKRQSGDLSVILLDVDHFKTYNDTNGHPMGDQLLRDLAYILDQESAKRVSDIVARYGGEEFVFILPFTDYQGALVKAERIRSLIEGHAFAQGEKQPLGKVSASLGVATFPKDAVSASGLIEVADKALYQAKDQGRNRVVGYESLKSLPEKKANTEPRQTLGAVLKDFETQEGEVKILNEASASPAPAVEEPVAEEVSTPAVVEVEAPAVSVAEVSATVVESPATIEAPTAVEAPVVEVPVVEAPAVSVAEVSATVVESPATVETPTAVEVTPAVEAPAVEVPVVETPVAQTTTSEPDPIQQMLDSSVEATTDAKPEVAEATAASVTPAPAPAAAAKPKLKRKALGPEVDVDDLMSTIESAYEASENSTDELKAVLFGSEDVPESPQQSGDKRGTGSKR